MKIWKRITKATTRNAGKRLARANEDMKTCVWCDAPFAVTPEKIVQFREDLRGDPNAGVYAGASDKRIAEMLDLCDGCAEL